jgi:hypothetical protein
VKYKFKKKYEPHIMLYQVISKNGLSKPWFKRGGLAVNKIYINDCLKKITIPFIKKNHQDGNFWFWPDKASSHYARETLEFLAKNNIQFVPKERNPTNLPQCRPIEDYFGQLDTLVYKDGWRAKDLDELENRIRLCIRKVNKEAVQASCASIKTKLRKCADHGPYALVH